METMTLDTRLVAALERFSRLFKSLLWEVAREVKLSPIQIQFLVFLSSHPRSLCRVGVLAREFELTPATVSDAVRVLMEKELISKETLPEDHRVQVLRLTPMGESSVQNVEGWADSLRKLLETFPENEKENTLYFLLNLIVGLRKQGVISPVRMCLACQHFNPDRFPESSKPHFCTLTEMTLGLKDLQVDCNFHAPAEESLTE